ncbi:M20/M25/M40 family metallo-hydrolase [Roseomonas sp. 18066]|uniref:M20/M25/M40 family metallo-hydrolase n=1 Tax=Roseomonas sp. 18066 TaxID=2681412 RepID=UPI00135C28A2|nr:M20/M25/M40 family metallo-hydrolase [Roseomonas sp. 18066]
MATTAALRAAINARIDADRGALIDLLQQFLRIRSVNPPGDTREAAEFVRAILDRHGVPHRTLSAVEEMPNIVGRWDGARPGRHLVLNGHMDVFPVQNEALWEAPIRDGLLYGRGASDMKTGTLAGIMAYCYLYPHRAALAGALSLTVVSDEQSGGRYGTRFLFEQHPEVVEADCCLNGEPSALGNIRFMEKGTLRFSLSSTGIGGHGGYPHQAPNPIERIVKLTQAIYDRFHLKLGEMDPAIDALLTAPETVATADRLLGQGAAENARRITVNIGIIQGGQKATQIPTACSAHLDIRLPYGTDRDAVRAELEAMAAAGHCTMLVNEDHSYPASMTDPECEMARILRRNTKELLDLDGPPVCSLGGTDARYWRWRGIPAVICGPSNLSMGTDQEHVAVEEAIAVIRLQALCAADYLAAG